MTYNIRKGKGASGRRKGHVDSLGEALRPHAPDILLAQEVYHGNLGDGDVSQTQHIGEILGLAPFYEPNRVRRRGHYGNATFTRYPVVEARNFNITTNPIEKRGVFYLRLDMGDRPLHIFNAHLGLNSRQRAVQIRRIAHLIEEICEPLDPLLLGGDFNDWNRRVDAFVTGELGFVNAFAEITGRAAHTWHARRPMFNLDRVYARNLRVEQALRLDGDPWHELSDHLPLVVDLL